MKRYEKYKPSGIEWIGEVPNEWNVCRLKNTLKDNLMYGANESAECDDPSYPRYIRITDMTDDGKLRDETFKSLEPEKAKPYLLKKGDILFARSGATVGKTFLFDMDIVACFAGYLIKASFNDTVIPKYVYYYSQSGLYENWKNSVFIQATIQNIGAEKYANLPFIRPALNEQINIVGYLDARCGDIDKVVATQEKRIALLNEMKQSIITQAVTRGLNPNAKMKDSGVVWIGMVPEQWVVTRIGRLADNVPYAMVDGPFGSDMKNEEYVDEGVPIVQLTNIKPFYHYMGFQNYITEEKHQQLIRHTANCGDIVIAKMMPAGRACVLSADYPEYVVAADAIRFAVSPDADKAFVLYCLNTYCMQECELVSKGTTRVRINLEIARKLNIAMPPKNEQTEIVLFLEKRCSEIDKQIKAVTRQIELLREYKQSLITEVVTGKRKVC